MSASVSLTAGVASAVLVVEAGTAAGAECLGRSAGETPASRRMTTPTLTREEIVNAKAGVPRTVDAVRASLAPEEKALMHEDARTAVEIARLRKELAAARVAHRKARNAWRASPAFGRVQAADDHDFLARNAAVITAVQAKHPSISRAEAECLAAECFRVLF